MKYTPDEGAKPFMYRVGMGEMPGFRGMDRDSDPGAIAPNRFHLLQNVRLEGPPASRRLICRGGQTKLSAVAITGTVKGLFEMGLDQGEEDLVSLGKLPDIMMLGNVLPGTGVDSTGATAGGTVDGQIGTQIGTVADFHIGYVINMDNGSKIVLTEHPGRVATNKRVTIHRILGTYSHPDDGGLDLVMEDLASIDGLIPAAEVTPFISHAIQFRDGIVFSTTDNNMSVWAWKPREELPRKDFITSGGFLTRDTRNERIDRRRKPEGIKRIYTGAGSPPPSGTDSSRIMIGATSEYLLLCRSAANTLSGQAPIWAGQVLFSPDPFPDQGHIATWTNVTVPATIIDSFSPLSVGLYGDKIYVGGSGKETGYTLLGTTADNAHVGWVLFSWTPGATSLAQIDSIAHSWSTGAGIHQYATVERAGYVSQAVVLEANNTTTLYLVGQREPPTTRTLSSRWSLSKYDGTTLTVLHHDFEFDPTNTGQITRDFIETFVKNGSLYLVFYGADGTLMVPVTGRYDIHESDGTDTTTFTVGGNFLSNPSLGQQIPDFDDLLPDLRRAVRT